MQRSEIVIVSFSIHAIVMFHYNVALYKDCIVYGTINLTL